MKPDVLQSANAVPAHVAGRFREVAGFQQAASGQYFVFDRRAHTLKGETFPDPTEDDSLQKLRKDDAFWSLAQQISQQLKSEKKL